MPARLARRSPRFSRVLWTIVGVAGLVAITDSLVVADRPSAMKLFPEDTLLFIRMANAKEFAEKLRGSGTGRMLRDPKLQPFIEDVYGKAGELYAETAEAIMGITWDELQKLPQGEVAFGIVTRPGLMPAFLLLVDQGDEPSAAQQLVDRALEFAEEKGGELSSEKIGDVEVTVVRHSENMDRMFGLFERDNTIVVGTDPDVLRSVLWQWDAAEGRGEVAAETANSAAQPPGGEVTSVTGESKRENDDGTDPHDEAEHEFVPGRTLAENTNFSTVLRQCRRPQDPPPNLIAFADPIGLFAEFSQGNPGARLAYGFLPQIGVDGILGIGGALTFAADTYDELAHYHLLIENPRSGVLQLLTFETGDTAPQPFVPFATENYYTGYWNAGVFYDRIRELIDKLLGDGTFDRYVPEKFNEAMGVDLRTDVIDNLAGRISAITGYEKPAHFRSQKHTLVVELADEEAGQEILRKIVDKFSDQFEERTFGSVKYYAITPDWWKEMEEANRPFNAFVAIMDGNFFIGGSCELFEQQIAARDGTIERLVDSDDYARIVASIGRETSGVTPSVFMIQRAEESIRHLYELVTSEETRTYIEEHAEENPILAKLGESLKDHQLPPFETLMQYFGAGGGILYDTDDGYHGVAFTLRDETAP